MNLFILLPAVILLLLLLYAEKRESIPGKLMFKPLLSALFVLSAFLQPWPVPTYAAIVIAGLILSWIGDLCLIFFTSPKMFLSGLVSFLLGHACYAAGFYTHGVWSLWVATGLAAILAVGALIFFWLRPHLGNMIGPVIVYILVISAMVGGAVALFGAPSIEPATRWLVLLGAIVFYVSDIFVARDRFVKPGFDNRLLGLSIYYLAQFMFAISVGQGLAR